MERDQVEERLQGVVGPGHLSREGGGTVVVRARGAGAEQLAVRLLDDATSSLPISDRLQLLPPAVELVRTFVIALGEPLEE